MRPTFEALYRDHFGLVWSIVARAGVAPGSREDAMQEVWLTVHRRIDSYDDSMPAASWVAGITRHVVWRQIRATIRARRKLVALDRVAPEALDDPMVSRERMRGIEGVIATLEPPFRDALVAVDIFGSTGPEAAEQLGLPLNTLYSRLRLARARLHAGLDALEQQPSVEPPRGLAERTWVVIAPSLGVATAAPTTMIAIAAGLAAVVTVAVTTIASAEPPARATGVAIAGAHGDRGDASPSDEPSIVAAEPPAIDPPVVSAAIVAESTAPPLTKPRAGEASPPEPDEGALLALAMKARRKGDLEAAMAAIGEHERRFPDGRLAIERKVERVRALCAAGKAAQARGEATALARAHAESLAVAGLGDGCAPSRGTVLPDG